MTKKLYTFVITEQHRNHDDQDNLRDGIIKLLKIAPIEFRLENGIDKKHSLFKNPQEFAFETPEEARQFALRILETKEIFFCELKRVGVE